MQCHAHICSALLFMYSSLSPVDLKQLIHHMNLAPMFFAGDYIAC